jgi:DNA-binding GntR family transcriptional regulator
MQVSPLSVDEITGAYQVLAALERSALLHTPEVPPQMVQRLRAATRKRQAAGSDVGRSCAADLEWHRALTGFTSNRILERMLEAPRFIAERYERAFFRSIPDVARSSAEHERIETALGAGKLDEAGGLVEAHWLGNIPAMTEIISRTE